MGGVTELESYLPERVCPQGGRRRGGQRDPTPGPQQLAATEGEDAEELRKEIEDLEGRIDELTSFRTGTEVHE